MASNTYIPQTHQSLAQLQSQFGIISSSTNGTANYSQDIVKPTTVYTYSSSGTGEVVQLGEKNQILPQTNIYSSFDPSLNQQFTYTTTSVAPQRTSSQHSVTVGQGNAQVPGYNPYQYAISQVSNQKQIQQQQPEDEVVKRSKKNGAQSDSSDSSDDDKKVVTELKFNKKKWGKAYILFAKNTIEGLNNKLVSKDAHISQLIKATDLKDQQIQQLSIEINSLRKSSSSSTVVNIQGSADYQLLHNEYDNLSKRCEELELDNQQLAQIVQVNSEEKIDLLAQITLLATQVEAFSLQSKTQTVVVQSNYSPEVEIWKKKSGELEAELNKVRLSQSTQANIQLEVVNMQLRDRNAEIDRLKQQIIQLQNNTENLVKLEIENNTLQNQVKSLNSQITILNNQIVSLQQQVGDNSSSRLNITTLELKLRDYEAQIQGLQLQINQAGGQRQKVEQLEIENNTLQGQVKSLLSQVTLLNNQIISLHQKAGDSDKSKLTISQLELKIKDYETQIQGLQIQINQAGGQNQRIEQLEIQLMQLNNELRVKEQEINGLKQRCQGYENQLTLAINPVEVENVKRSNKELAEKLQQQQVWAENEIRQRELQIQELRQRCQQYEQNLSNNQQSLIELESLRGLLREYEEKLKILEQQQGNRGQFEELNVQIFNLSQQLKIQNQDASDLRSRCDNLQRQLQESDSRYQGVLIKLQETEYNNQVIIGQNNDLISNIRQLEQQYFQTLSQFVLVCSALESQSGNKSPSFDINYYSNQNNDMELKILRQDNTDLANKCVVLTNQMASKDTEIQQIFQRFNEIESSNKIIIDENSNLIRQLQEKDSEIARLKISSDSSSQVSLLQIQINDWKSKYEQSRNDIVVVVQQVERMKGIIEQKEQELITWRSKANQLTFLEGENSRLRMQIQNYEEEINMLKRTDRISAPLAGDNSHQLILQLTQRDQELEEHKKRLAAYALKNAELQGEIELMRNKRHGGDDLSSVGSQADKDQLIHKYRIENKRLNEDLMNLQTLVKNYQTEIRNSKGGRGCGYGCA